MNIKNAAGLILVISLLILVGCKDKITDTSGLLKLNVNGLVNLGLDARYEAWIIVDGTPESIGKFTVNSEGNLSITTFTVEKSILAAATGFFISIEPVPDPSPNHSNSIILAGNFGSATDSTQTNIAYLYIGHPLALSNNFLESVGNYVLSSPTDTNPMNETSGIWFMDVSSGYPHTGLYLPPLPTSWKYESWAVFLTNDNRIITKSMGKFTQANHSDLDSLYCGPLSQPEYPGEDFVNETLISALGLATPINMSGKNIYITVEPDPDFSPDPFFLTLLKAAIPANAAPHLTYTMTNQAVTSSPTGKATR